jgi:hypothetical protein
MLREQFKKLCEDGDRPQQGRWKIIPVK